MDTEKCSCASSWKLPRLTKNAMGKRVCSKCDLPRGRAKNDTCDDDPTRNDFQDSPEME